MKQFTLTLIVVLILLLKSNAQVVPAYVPKNGLKAWYPFNGNANDESGNGNNGLPQSGTSLTTDRFGVANAAYSFDGTNAGRIITPLSGDSGTQDRTISFWFNPTANIQSVDGHAMLSLSYGASSVCGNGFSCAFFYDEPAIDIYCAYKSMNFHCSTNQWYFYTVTYSSVDGNTTLSPKLYINTILQTGINASYNTSLVMNTLNTLKYDIGGNGKTGHNFTGMMDDIGFWNRVLTTQEINQLYTATNPVTKTCLPAYVPVNGLKAWYPFCGNANDESGNGKNALPQSGASLTTDRFGNLNSAYTFDGSNTGHLITPLTGDSGTNDRTISFWFNPSLNQQTTDGFAMLSLSYGASAVCGNGFSCAYFYDEPAIDIYCAFKNVSYHCNTNQWYFYTVTYSSSYGNTVLSPKVYINTVLQSGINSSYNTSLVLNTLNTLKYTIGGIGVANHNFTGKMDDIGFWNRVLTQQEIVQLYNATDLPVNFFSFNVANVDNSAILKWQTSDELNVSSYLVERSFNGKDFKSINTLNASNSTINNYSYKDNSVNKSSTNVFYRIVALDKDGHKTFSEIKSLIFTGNESLVVYPNPVTNGIIKLQLNLKQNKNIVFRLSDNTGRVLVEQKNDFSKGLNNCTIPINKLYMSGEYFLQAKGIDGISVQKILIK